MSANKITDALESPLTRLRKLSPSMTHAFAEYPLYYEAVNYLLSIAIVHYFATFFAKVCVSFESDILKPLTPFVYDWYYALDELFLNHALKRAEKYIPWMKTLHYANLTPSALKKTAQSYLTKAQGYVKSQADPIVANTVSSVNPVLAPVNKTLESAINQYLPSDSVIATPTTESNEVTKLISLTRDATGRTITVVHNTASKAFKLPGDISQHVSKIYGSELKERHSIPSAIVHTSSELVSEVTANLGLNNKAAATSQVIQTKVNGVAQVAGEATGAVLETVAQVENHIGQISVGA